MQFTEIKQADYEFGRENDWQVMSADAYLANDALDDGDTPTFVAFFTARGRYFRSIDGYTVAEFIRQWPE